MKKAPSLPCPFFFGCSSRSLCLYTNTLHLPSYSASFFAHLAFFRSLPLAPLPPAAYSFTTVLRFWFGINIPPIGSPVSGEANGNPLAAQCAICPSSDDFW